MTTINSKQVDAATSATVTGLGTGTGINVQSMKNFTLVIQQSGTGTGVGKIQGTMDGTNYYDILWGTATSGDSGTVTISEHVSNQAHSNIRFKTMLPGQPHALATITAWIKAN